MITIYKKDEADFTHRGLGTLPDATEAEVQEIINGIFDLRVTYPKDGRKADLLQEERIIKASTPKGDQTFRIYKIRKDLPYIEAHALHRFYDLSNNFIEDTFIQNKGGQAALQQLLDMSILPHNFSAVSDVPGPMNLRIVRYNTVAAIMGDEEENTLLKRGGGEIERDNLIIRWKQRLGEDRGVKIKYRKNLLGLDFESDYSPVVTRIMPQGFDGLFLPEKYVDSPRINDYHMPKIQKREYPVISAEKNPDEEGAIPHDQALAKLRTLAAEEFSNGLDLPSVSCFVDFIDLAQTAEYKEYQVLERIYIGDTIHVIYPEQNIELSARMTMYTWDALKHRYNTMFVGTMKNELQSAISAGEKALVKAEEVQQSMMEKAREVATALINSGFGGHVRIHPDKVLIMDTEDEATAQKVWQWNLNGLGYSKTGINGPYTTAMVDGQILGERITAGSITVNQVAADFGQSLDISSNVAITARVTKEEILTDPEIQEVLKGEKGDSGEDALPMTTHYAWADSPDGKTGFSRTDSTKKYRGQVVAPPLNYLMGEVEGFGRNLYIGSNSIKTTGWSMDYAWSEDGKYGDLNVYSKDTPWGGLHKNMPVEQGDEITFSCFAYVEQGGTLRYYEGYMDENDVFYQARQELLGGNFPNENTTIWVVREDRYPEEFERRWVSIKITNPDSVKVRPRVENDVDGKTLYVCGLKLEKGTVPTPYMIAPEDLDLPETYVWSQVRGEDGAEGPQGIQGPPGKDVDPEKLQLIEDTINEIKSTGHITPADKQNIYIRAMEVKAEKETLEAQEIVTSSEKWEDYIAAYNAAFYYLALLLDDMTSTSQVDPEEFTQKFTNYDNALKELLTAVENQRRSALMSLAERISSAEQIITDENIRQIISSAEIYKTKEEAETELSGLMEQIRQLREKTSEFETNLSGFSSEVTTKLTENDQILESFTNYFRFEDGVVKLGNSLETLYLEQTNDRISFMNGEVEEAYFSNKTLTVNEIESTRVNLGPYEITATGNKLGVYYNGN